MWLAWLPRQMLNGLADHFEKKAPAMHQTDTVDCAILYEEEIWLELDNAKIIHLKHGRVVVRNGTRRAWRNRGTRPVTHALFPERRKSVTRRDYIVKRESWQHDSID
jgi:hypothetical protein